MLDVKKDAKQSVAWVDLALCSQLAPAVRVTVDPAGQAAIEIRRDVLEEVDGPVLKHALQGLHGASIQLPRRAAHRPDWVRSQIRHQRFLGAGR